MKALLILGSFLLSTGGETQDPVTDLPDVVVRGTPVTISSAETFVDRISTRPFGALTLGRWESPICPEIINLEGEKPEIILRRLRARAAEAGAPVGGSDCRPNISIVLTADGTITAKDFVNQAPRFFRVSPGRTQGNRADLDRFMNSEAPIRWWHTSGLYDTNRQAFISTSGSTPSVVNTDGNVYFNQDRRQAFLSALIIVDVSQLRSIDLTTLADYLAFVVLAQVEPQPAIVSFPSILNLWEEGNNLTALTAWDMGYLRGLYTAKVRISGSGTAVETGYQQTEIARTVLASAREAASGE